MFNRKEWRILFGIGLMTFIVFLDITIVSTALPAIQHEFSATITELQWILNALFLALSALMASIGRIGDIFGRRRVVYTGTLLFLLASIGAGCATSIGWLIFFRFLQGIAGATIPVSAALLTNHFAVDRQPRVMGAMAMITGSGMALGPLIGGVLVQNLGWRWIFFVNIPIIILAFTLCVGVVEEQRHKDTAARINIPGTCSMIIAVSSLIIGLSQGPGWSWDSAAILSIFGVSFISFVLFFRINRHNPVIDLQLFRNPYFVAATLSGFAMGGIVGVLLFLNPLYLESMRHYSAEHAGFTLLAISGSFVLASPFFGKFVQHYGAKAGLYMIALLCIAASILHAQFGLQTPLGLIVFAFILFGLAWSMSNVAPVVAVISTTDNTHSAVALGSLWTIWNIGSCICLAVCGFLIRQRGEVFLFHQLQLQHIVLSTEQHSLIRSLFLNPEQASHVLSQFSQHTMNHFLPIFEMAFMQGFDSAMYFLIALSLITCLAIYGVLRKSPHAA